MKQPRETDHLSPTTISTATYTTTQARGPQRTNTSPNLAFFVSTYTGPNLWLGGHTRCSVSPPPPLPPCLSPSRPPPPPPSSSKIISQGKQSGKASVYVPRAELSKLRWSFESIPVSPPFIPLWSSLWRRETFGHGHRNLIPKGPVTSNSSPPRPSSLPPSLSISSSLFCLSSFILTKPLPRALRISPSSSATSVASPPLPPPFP